LISNALIAATRAPVLTQDALAVEAKNAGALQALRERVQSLSQQQQVILRRAVELEIIDAEEALCCLSTSASQASAPAEKPQDKVRRCGGQRDRAAAGLEQQQTSDRWQLTAACRPPPRRRRRASAPRTGRNP
jgi:hypothetical protein